MDAPGATAPDAAPRDPFWPLGLAAAVISALVVVPVHHLWNASLRVPFEYVVEDAGSTATIVKTALDHGWYWTNSNLGAPFTQHFVDYSFNDNVHIVFLRLIGVVLHDYAAVINVYYLLGYVLVAVAAAWAMWRLGLSRGVALAAAVLYSFLPYHQLRGEGHLFLGAYFAVPIACFLIVRSLDARPLVRVDDSRTGWRKYVTRRNTLIVAACVFVGAANGYYAVFALFLLALVAVLQLLRSRDRALVASTVCLLVAIGLSLAVNMAPTIAYHRTHGPNEAIAYGHGDLGDSERCGLKVAALLLPRPDHRVGFLDRIDRRYQEATPVSCESKQSLGLVGAAGLLLLLLLAVVGPRMTIFSGVAETLWPLAAVNLGAILLATVGGFATLVAFVAPEVRGWNRISVFVGFFALFALGTVADRSRGARWLPAVLALVVVVGVLDQTRNPDSFAPTKAEFASDAAFVRGIESKLGDDARVFQLPYVGYPEGEPPTPTLGGYDHARGYLQSDTLKWSWGAMRGRPEAAWQERLVDASADEILAAAAERGFRGIYIDRFGYADRGVALEARLAELIPQTPLVSRNGRLVLYDLRGYAG